MNNYSIYINVTAVAGQWVTVTADSITQACERVEEMVKNNDIDLDWGHYNIGCDRVEEIAAAADEGRDGR